MTPERFVHLADAYGADLQRWPASERAAAQVLIENGDAAALDALQQARWLDGRLNGHTVAAPDADLVRRIVLSADSAVPLSFWARYGAWLSRLGFVGAGLAGLATGMLVMSLSLPISSSPDLLPSIFDHGDADLVLSVDAEESDQ